VRRQFEISNLTFEEEIATACFAGLAMTSRECPISGLGHPTWENKE